MRGEYSSCVVGQDTTLELPPHARRIRGVNPARRIIRGTTSACAENTCRWHPSSLGCWNYLRMRGEYPSPLYMRPASLELPPHARRILRGSYRGHPTTGTTSACAENTTPRHSQSDSIRNYLRMRGEYVIQNSNKEVILELPPHARRIPRRKQRWFLYRGTTSACAENTRTRLGVPSAERNYLRMRGEYAHNPRNRVPCGELPPHARRIQRPVVDPVLAGGTTSACAENT